MKRTTLEELAHSYLWSLGVPHDITPASFVQEAFAVWVVAASFGLDAPRLPPLDFDWQPLQNNVVAYIAGSCVGAEWASVDSASDALDDWQSAEPPDSVADVERRFLALATQELRRHNPRGNNPLAVGEALAAWYRVQAQGFVAE
ncbi:MAG: hypothetical protein MSC30_11895 [Gaiellaceae bacterium MAG52_C11]|nr:hypothetical protein [Candidatus Gaiellasilicea maunaloa]